MKRYIMSNIITPGDESLGTRMKAASDPDTRPATLDTLANDSNIAVRYFVWKNPSTPAEIRSKIKIPKTYVPVSYKVYLDLDCDQVLYFNTDTFIAILQDNLNDRGILLTSYTKEDDLCEQYTFDTANIYGISFICTSICSNIDSNLTLVENAIRDTYDSLNYDLAGIKLYRSVHNGPREQVI